jgi:glycosyltransferase involved in cell wall biosynthesis
MSLNPNGRRLRVWHIAETYPPGYGGGAAIYIQDVARSLASRGHEVRILCTEATEDEPYSVRTDFDDSVRVDRVNLPYFKRHDPDGWQLGLGAWRAHEQRIGQIIKKAVDEWKPDLVHYSASRPFGEECLLAIRSLGIPIVGFLHEAWLICPRLMLLRSPTSEPCKGPGPLRCAECMYSHYDGSHARAMAKLPWRVLKLGLYPAYRMWRRARARKGLSGALGYSRFMVDTHKELIDGQVSYVPLGINLEGIESLPPLRPRGVLRFGFLAGFQQTKGITDVLDAAASLRESGLEFELHVWGPNLEQGTVEIEKRGLEDRVFLRGMYTANELWRVYSEIHVALMATTVCEPLGRIPLEAAAAGAPTIAPAIGGITETIRDGVDGLLYKFRDSKDLESKMRRVLVEPGLVGHLIENLRAVPDTRDRAAAVEQFYYEVLGLGSPAPAVFAV